MLSIYAEISHRLLKEIEAKENSGQPHIFSNLPNGVFLERKKGKTACFFEYDDEVDKTALIDLLDSKNIPWQDN